jgi:hypothetical protein
MSAKINKTDMEIHIEAAYIIVTIPTETVYIPHETLSYGRSH